MGVSCGVMLDGKVFAGVEGALGSEEVEELPREGGTSS